MLVFEGVNEMKHLNNISYKDCVGKVVDVTLMVSHPHKNHGGSYWFKEGDLTNAISPFTLIKIT